MFTDVHNFSVAMIGLQLQRSCQFVQALYETIGESVAVRSGEILKYLGDGVFVLFPEDRAVEAIECGIEMRANSGELVSKWELPAEIELEVGISFGEIGIGIFGHPSLLQRDAFGEAINEAAMIGHHRGIAIADPVRNLLNKKFVLHPLPDANLKWRSSPLKVWEIEEEAIDAAG